MTLRASRSPSRALRPSRALLLALVVTVGTTTAACGSSSDDEPEGAESSSAPANDDTTTGGDALPGEATDEGIEVDLGMTVTVVEGTVTVEGTAAGLPDGAIVSVRVVGLSSGVPLGCTADSRCVGEGDIEVAAGAWSFESPVPEPDESNEVKVTATFDPDPEIQPADVAEAFGGREGATLGGPDVIEIPEGGSVHRYAVVEDTVAT